MTIQFRSDNTVILKPVISDNAAILKFVIPDNTAILKFVIPAQAGIQTCPHRNLSDKNSCPNPAF
ncbi:hypothetical protein NM2002004_0979 [Neisseria meningitidis 2002004]|uniref:hypothetical protein n=1 Tax=Neisseria meningitidis TaxID=487 RepID=UPI00032DA372|nr:hypothetical protein [Neisseria meningitidis]EOC48418.1 hypothetical protein NM2002004_0979 [Neisseria meningitidis 2002004]